MMLIDEQQMKFFHPKLLNVIAWFKREFGIQRITSLYRPGDPGVHGQIPLRGTDFGCRNDDLGKLIEKTVNRKFIYDPQRPHKNVCIYHDVGQGKHLHFQVHDRTEER